MSNTDEAMNRAKNIIGLHLAEILPDPKNTTMQHDLQAGYVVIATQLARIAAALEGLNEKAEPIRMDPIKVPQ